jgi:hypothetical protein
MKHGAPFRVMVYAPPLGRHNAPPIVTVGYYAYTLEDALRWANRGRQGANARGNVRMWIQRAGYPASRRSRESQRS